MTATAGRYLMHGVGASAGWVAGPVARVVPAPGLDPAEPGCRDPEADQARVAHAIAEAAGDLREQARLATGEAAEILAVTAKLAEDPALLTTIRRHLDSGRGVTASVHAAVEDLVGLGGFLAERATDLEEIRDRVTAVLRGTPTPGLPVLGFPAVLVADQLAPVQLSRVDRSYVLGLITRGGGPTDHTAIIAAQMSLPIIVQVADAGELGEGTTVAINGSTGTIVVNPAHAEIDEQHTRRRRRAALQSSISGPGVTADGHPVAVLANVNGLNDMKAAREVSAVGTGLYRTEFLYLDRLRPPSLEEQTEYYVDLFNAHPDGAVVTARTLDVGGDKPLEYLSHSGEANPALGSRGIRMAMRHPELLETQLVALAQAQDYTRVTLRVMAPMISTVEETDIFLALARQAGLRTVGVMLETPAAAVKAGQLLADADFASIGVNDLTQYTMAADRLDGSFAHLLDPWQPAVLSLVSWAARAAADTRTPLGMCGEAAADPLLALVYAGMGADSLSMVPTRIPAVRTALAHHDLATCQAMASAALAARAATEAHQAALELADPIIHELD